MSNNTSRHAQTVAPISAATTNAAELVRPEFIRPPKGGLETYSGLSRAKLYELISANEGNGFKPPVKSVCLRKPGAIKGARLIHLQSLLDYLHRNAEGGE